MKNSVLTDLFLFVRKPDELKNNKLNIFKSFAIVLLFDLTISLVLIGLVSFLGKILNSTLEENSINKLLYVYPTWLVILLGVISIPIIEEFIFRFMIIFKRCYPIKFYGWIKSKLNKSSINAINESLYSKWSKNYRIIFYSSAFLFAIYHLFNYQINESNFYFLPLLVLPQFILANLIGFLRVRFNFFMGTLLHITHNGIFIAIALIFVNNNLCEFENETVDYSIKISENNKISKYSDVYLSENLDSIVSQNLDLKELIYMFTGRDKMFIEFANNPNNRKSHFFNINFKSHIKNETQNFSIVKTALEDEFGITWFDTLKLINCWELKNFDLNLMEQFKEKSKITESEYKSKKGKIYFKNLKLHEILSVLSTTFDKKIIYNDVFSNQEKYNIEFDISNFNKFKIDAYQKYKFEFVQIKYKDTLTVIKFDN